MVDATKAKEIALMFFKLTKQEVAPTVLGRIISQVKRLMTLGYTSEEIEYTIKELIMRNPKIYSFGYVEKAIDDTLMKRAMEVKKEMEKATVIEITEQLNQSLIVTSESEVTGYDETSERNKRKAERFRELQPGFGKKSYFDMFEGE